MLRHRPDLDCRCFVVNRLQSCVRHTVIVFRISIESKRREHLPWPWRDSHYRKLRLAQHSSCTNTYNNASRFAYSGETELQ